MVLGTLHLQRNSTPLVCKGTARTKDWLDLGFSGADCCWTALAYKRRETQDILRGVVVCPRITSAHQVELPKLKSEHWAN